LTYTADVWILTLTGSFSRASTTASTVPARIIRTTLYTQPARIRPPFASISLSVANAVVPGAWSTFATMILPIKSIWLMDDSLVAKKATTIASTHIVDMHRNAWSTGR